MEKPQYKDHVEFFERAGNYWLRPDSWGIDQPVTVEEMYQHFKARFLDEYTPPGVVRVDPD